MTCFATMLHQSCFFFSLTIFIVTVTHQNKKDKNLYVKTYLTINLFLISDNPPKKSPNTYLAVATSVCMYQIIDVIRRSFSIMLGIF